MLPGPLTLGHVLARSLGLELSLPETGKSEITQRRLPPKQVCLLSRLSYFVSVQWSHQPDSGPPKERCVQAPRWGPLGHTSGDRNRQ